MDRSAKIPKPYARNAAARAGVEKPFKVIRPRAPRRRPRGYRMQARAAEVAANRQSMLAAARALLGDEAAPPLTLEAVARAAGVSRATVYNQLGSRAGLLAALLDDVGSGAEAARVGAAAARPDGRVALAALVAATCRCWAAEEAVMRRLTLLGGLDRELARALGAREAGRRLDFARVAARLRREGALGRGMSPARAARLWAMLTSFASWDNLARAGLPARAIAAELTALAYGLVA